MQSWAGAATLLASGRCRRRGGAERGGTTTVGGGSGGPTARCGSGLSISRLWTV